MQVGGAADCPHALALQVSNDADVSSGINPVFAAGGGPNGLEAAGELVAAEAVFINLAGTTAGETLQLDGITQLGVVECVVAASEAVAVIAGAAVEQVAASPAADGVVASPAIDGVVAAIALQDVVAAIANELVGVLAAGDVLKGRHLGIDLAEAWDVVDLELSSAQIDIQIGGGATAGINQLAALGANNLAEDIKKVLYRRLADTAAADQADVAANIE